MSANISDEQLNAMLQMASKKLGIPPEKLKSALSDPGKAQSLLTQIDKNTGGKINASDTASLENMIKNNPKAKKMFDDLTKNKH